MATEAPHLYRDLRSASRPKHRERARNNKYNSFRTVHASDLPSTTSKSTSRPPHTQQEHYLPVCALPECPTAGTTDGHFWSIFSADLCARPIAKFTAREAYEEGCKSAYWQRRHHADLHKDFAKWERQRAFKKLCKREIREDPQGEDPITDEWVVDWDLDQMDEVFQYMNFGKRPEIFESWEPFTEYGETFDRWCKSRGITPDEYRQRYLAIFPQNKRGLYWEGSEYRWSWQRNITGCWEFDLWRCDCWTCDCAEAGKGSCNREHKTNTCSVDWGDWTPEGPQRYSLARWCKGMLKDGVLWDEKEEEEEEEEEGEDLEWDGDGDWADHRRDDIEDWDVLSVVSSTWTEIGDSEDLELQFVK